MRPPPAGGGYVGIDWHKRPGHNASMRPPPAGGGYPQALMIRPVDPD